jgi:hypothetical protein
MAAVQFLNKVSQVPQTRIQASVTPAQRHQKINQKVPEVRVVGAAQDPSGFSPGVSELE